MNNIFISRLKSISLTGFIAPIVDTGPNETVNSDGLVQHDGSSSSDPRDESLTYQWKQTQGPEVTLDESTIANPSFRIPYRFAGYLCLISFNVKFYNIF